MPSGIISDYEYDAAGRLTSPTHYAPRDAIDHEDTDPAFGSTGTGFLTFDVQSFAEEVIRMLQLAYRAHHQGDLVSTAYYLQEFALELDTYGDVYRI